MGDTCATCRHWQFAAPDWQFDELVIGECKAIRMREHIEEDAARHLPDGRWDDAAEPLIAAALRAERALVVDASGYHAALRTTADFGCVRHAPGK